MSIGCTNEHFIYKHADNVTIVAYLYVITISLIYYSWLRSFLPKVLA